MDKPPPKLLLSMFGILKLSAEGIIGIVAAVAIASMLIFGTHLLY